MDALEAFVHYSYPTARPRGRKPLLSGSVEGQMSKARAEQQAMESTEFYCRSKKRRVTMAECLERYVDANAFENKRSACWRCYQGRKVRSDYAAGAG